MDICAWYETREEVARTPAASARTSPARARPQQPQWSDPGAYARFVGGMRQNGSTERGIAWLLSSDP